MWNLCSSQERLRTRIRTDDASDIRPADKHHSVLRWKRGAQPFQWAASSLFQPGGLVAPADRSPHLPVMHLSAEFRADCALRVIGRDGLKRLLRVSEFSFADAESREQNTTERFEWQPTDLVRVCEACLHGAPPLYGSAIQCVKEAEIG